MERREKGIYLISTDDDDDEMTGPKKLIALKYLALDFNHRSAARVTRTL